jgi:hypothetical protein
VGSRQRTPLGNIGFAWNKRERAAAVSTADAVVISVLLAAIATLAAMQALTITHEQRGRGVSRLRPFSRPSPRPHRSARASPNF